MMQNPQSSSSCTLYSPIDATRNFQSPSHNPPCNSHATTDLKSLALLVLERNTLCNNAATKALHEECKTPTEVASKVASAYEQVLSLDNDGEERAAFIQYGTGLPREWAEAYAALCGNQGTLCADIHAQAVDDGGRFLDDWGKQAAALGWKPEWVFSNTPLMAGLVFTIMGGDVLAIGETTAKLRMVNGTLITCCLTRRDVQKFGCHWEVVGYG